MTRQELIERIKSNIYTNKEQKITGQILQDVLIDMLCTEDDVLNFVVPANTTEVVSVFDNDKHKAVEIRYLIGTNRMGVLRITSDTFKEIDVTGYSKNIIILPATNNSISISNETDVDIEVCFKVDYMKK